MKKQAKRPKIVKSKNKTLTGTPQLGYLNSVHCPVCNKHLFSFYDADVLPNREDGFQFSISEDWNYCSKCGAPLDLSEWKHETSKKKMLSHGIITGAETPVEFEDCFFEREAD